MLRMETSGETEVGEFDVSATVQKDIVGLDVSVQLSANLSVNRRVAQAYLVCSCQHIIFPAVRIAGN